MAEERRTSLEEARRVGDQIGVEWDRFERMEREAERDWAARRGAS